MFTIRELCSSDKPAYEVVSAALSPGFKFEDLLSDPGDKTEKVDGYHCWVSEIDNPLFNESELNESELDESNEVSAAAGICIARKIFGVVELLYIGVLQEHRGRGCSSGLMQRLVEWCNRSAVDQIQLEVRASNKAALSLYQKFGYELVGNRAGYYAPSANPSLEGGRETALLYTLVLTSPKRA